MTSTAEQNGIDARTALDRADDLDAAGFTEYFADDATLTFANRPPWSGKAEIRKRLAAAFSEHAALRHTIKHQWTVGDTTILEMSVTYIRHDGRDVTVPAVSIFSQVDGRIKDYRIHVDQAPLFAP